MFFLGGALGGHLLQQGANFLGVAGFQRVRFEEMQHQQAGIALVEFIDEMFHPSLLDVLRGDGGLVNEGQLAAIAGDHPLGFQPIEQGGDGGVRPKPTAGLQGFENLSNGPLAKLPKNLQDVQFGIGDRRRSFRHGLHRFFARKRKSPVRRRSRKTRDGRGA